MTREKVVGVLDMFLHKQCDLARTASSYDYNTIWKAINFAREYLNGVDEMSDNQFIGWCDSSGMRLCTEDKRYTVHANDGEYDLCGGCVEVINGDVKSGTGDLDEDDAE